MRGIYTDFMNKSLPMRPDGPTSFAEAAALIDGLSYAEIGRVVFVPRYIPSPYPQVTRVESFIKKRNIIFHALKEYLPRDARWSLSAEIVLRPSCFDDKNISALALEDFGRKYIFVSLPCPCFDSILWKDINRLTYHLNIYPIFTNFERNLLTYSPDDIKAIEKTPNAVFQFCTRALDVEKTVEYVIHLLETGHQFVFGAGARRLGVYEAETGDHFDPLKKYLGEIEFNRLMLSMYNFCRPRN